MTTVLQRFQDPAVLRSRFVNDMETMPTRRVWRGTGRPTAHEQRRHDLDTLQVPGVHGRCLDLATFLAEAESTALVVLHRGKLVYERYLHGMRAHDTHVTASITKSVVSLLAGLLLRDGVLSRTQALAHYVPDLAGTAFGEATLDHLLHMTTAVQYEGRPFDKETEARRFFAAVGMMPRPEDYNGPRNIMERLATARAEQPSGRIFRYENGNTEALGKAIRRVTGTSLAQLASDLLWSRIGAAENAHFTLDPSGREIACGRFSSTARDLALLGEVLRRGGAAAGGTQVIDEALVADITKIPEGPSRDVVGSGDVRGTNGPVMAYRDFWWLPLDGEGAFVARGRSGQRLYVSPRRELVVVHFGAHPIAPEVPVPRFEQVFAALGRELNGPL
jgi:CubicO group peptidase (beta-lactamase class C family)